MDTAAVSTWMRVVLIALVAVSVSEGQQNYDARAGPTHAGPQRFRRNGSSSREDVVQLRNTITELQDTWVRPDLGKATIVNVTLGVKHVTMNEMHSTMTVSAWIRLEWRDNRSAWQFYLNNDYKDVKVLHLNVDHVWHPDIVLKNSLAGKGASLLDGGSASLYPDGRVQWAPSTIFETYCELDLNRWPFERHVCHLHFGSWTLDKTQLKIGTIKKWLEFPGQTGEFIIDSVTEEYEEIREDGKDDPYDGAIFTIAMHREPGTYRAVIFTPAAVVIILCLSTFLLPPRAGEKIILGGVNAMLICLFLMYFAHSLPVLTNQTPFIVVFYSTSLYLVCLSLVVAVFVLNMSRQPHPVGLPWKVKRCLTGPCGRLLLLNGYIEQMMGVDHGPCSSRNSGRAPGAQEELPVVMHDQMDVLGDGSGDGSSREIASKGVDPRQDWLLLAAAIDRVLFIIYSVIFVVLAIAFHL